jgi:hypothetical protein
MQSDHTSPTLLGHRWLQVKYKENLCGPALIRTVMWLADISPLSHILARAKNPTLFSLFKELVDLGSLLLFTWCKTFEEA